MASHKIGILGAGNAGYTIAFHMAQQGHQVMLYEHPDFKDAVKPINDHGGYIIANEMRGEHKAAIHGKAKLEAATTDIKQVIEFADIVILLVPAFGQVPIFEQALPYLKDGQIFLILPGNFASLAFTKVMKEKGVTKHLIFAESETIPYACRRVQDNEIFISGIKYNMILGVFPGKHTDEVVAKLQPLFQAKFEKASNVLLAGIANTNMVAHPPPSLFNAGWIESRGADGSWCFYKEGVSKSVAKYIDRIDRERMAVADACGLKVRNVYRTLSHWYGADYPDTYTAYSTSPYHASLPPPSSLENRYVTEDIAYLLAPVAKLLAPKLGIPTPAMDAILVVAETLLDREMKPAREFSVVLKDGETSQQLQERLFTGNVD